MQNIEAAMPNGMQGTPIQDLQHETPNVYLGNQPIYHHTQPPPKFRCEVSQQNNNSTKEANDDLENIMSQNKDIAASSEEKLLGFIPENLRDPLIIFVLYMFLSLRPVQEFIGKYIGQINADGEGKVPYIGVIIYGLFLVSLFFIVKRVLE
jgi:hypothetical protein